MRATPKQRGGVTGKGFLPGHSGNAGGRPKGSKTYAIRQLVAEALNDPKVWKEAVERYRETLKTRKTVLLAGGAPITYVAAQLGHRKPTTTLLFYAHWIPGGDKSHIDRLAAARLAVEPKVPATLLDETNAPKAWRRSGAISKSVETSDAEVAERIGSP